MTSSAPLIITISRQLGSGGKEIGQIVAEKLKIRYVDREIISRAAQELSVLEEEIDERDERMLSFWKSFFQFNSLTMGVPMYPESRIATTSELFRVESEIIGHLASEQPSVIMGRCGYYILRDHPLRVTVYLHADDEARAKRLSKMLNISIKEAYRMIENTDKERTLYIETFTGNTWNDAHNFDLCIDTGRAGIEQSAALILQYARLLHPTICAE